MPEREIIQKLVEMHIRLVPYVIHKYFKPHYSLLEEYVAVGNIGLCKAAQKYDPTRNIAFSTFATKCICNEVLVFIRKEKKHQMALSYDADVLTCRNDLLPLHETILVADTDPSRLIEEKEACKQLALALKPLSERDKYVLYARSGIGALGKQTQRQIAQELGVSQSIVSRIQRAAVNEAKRALGDAHTAMTYV